MELAYSGRSSCEDKVTGLRVKNFETISIIIKAEYHIGSVAFCTTLSLISSRKSRSARSFIPVMGITVQRCSAVEAFDNSHGIPADFRLACRSRAVYLCLKWLSSNTAEQILQRSPFPACWSLLQLQLQIGILTKKSAENGLLFFSIEESGFRIQPAHSEQTTPVQWRVSCNWVRCRWSSFYPWFFPKI